MELTAIADDFIRIPLIGGHIFFPFPDSIGMEDWGLSPRSRTVRDRFLKFGKGESHVSRTVFK